VGPICYYIVTCQVQGDSKIPLTSDQMLIHGSDPAKLSDSTCHILLPHGPYRETTTVHILQIYMKS
jgi:hypothetical protein